MVSCPRQPHPVWVFKWMYTATEIPRVSGVQFSLDLIEEPQIQTSAALLTSTLQADCFLCAMQPSEILLIKAFCLAVGTGKEYSLTLLKSSLMLVQQHQTWFSRSRFKVEMEVGGGLWYREVLGWLLGHFGGFLLHLWHLKEDRLLLLPVRSPCLCFCAVLCKFPNDGWRGGQGFTLLFAPPFQVMDENLYFCLCIGLARGDALFFSLLYHCRRGLEDTWRLL